MLTAVIHKGIVVNIQHRLKHLHAAIDTAAPPDRAKMYQHIDSYCRWTIQVEITEMRFSSAWTHDARLGIVQL